MAILTMPADDISHPVPDLTGYITEGQIVLDRDLFQRGIYPPIAGLPSLSRLMKDGVGKGFTREDHPILASQLFACYAYVKRVRGLADVIGEEELSPLDKQYLKFGEAFEMEFLNQGEYENRSIETTLELGWDALSVLPQEELHRVSDELLKKHYRLKRGDARGGVQRHKVRTGMAKLNVAPTKSNLLNLERQLDFAQEGYDLLEQKRQILIFELMSRLSRAEEAEADAWRRPCGRRSTRCRKRRSISARRRSTGSRSACAMKHEIEMTDDRLMGMGVPGSAVRAEPMGVRFGVGGTSSNTDMAMSQFVDVLPLLAGPCGTRECGHASCKGTAPHTTAHKRPVEDIHPPVSRDDRLHHGLT